MKPNQKRDKKKSAKYIETEIKESIGYKDFIQFKNGVNLSSKQAELYQLILNNKITIATGPPGTAKTFSACYAALKLYSEGFCKKIILTKPTEIVSGTSELGFLPGDLKEKLEVYIESFIDNFKEIIDERSMKMLMDSDTIEFKPAQFVRGRTFNESVVIIDEFQSFDIKALMALVTRLGRKNCKMIFIGDTAQNDISKKFVAVDFFKAVLNGVKGAGIFQFDRSDIVRDKILIDIIDNYEKLKADGKLPQTRKNT